MKQRLFALAITATMAVLASSATTAATFDLKLVGVITGNPNGDAIPRIDLPGDDWIYDDVAETVSAGSRYEVQYLVGPFTVFRHNIDGFVLDASAGGGPANGTFFECIEGVFGPQNLGGVALCGNYRFGANFVDESLPTWGPGLAFDQGLNANPIAGGDDTSSGTPQNLNGEFDGASLQSWDGTTLVVGNFTTLVDGHQFTFVNPAEAVDDTDGVFQNSTDNVIAIGANDERWSPNPTVAEETAGDQGGTFVINSDPDIANVTVTYTPVGGFQGDENWTYRVTDTEGPLVGQTDTATLTVTVAPAGTATDDTGSTTSLSAPVDIAVGQNDIGFADPSTVTVTGDPAQGTTAVAGSPGPKNSIIVTYQSTAPLFTATFDDVFTYQISDGVLPAATANVTVTVNNTIPVAGDLGGITLDTQGVDPSTVSTPVDVGDGGDIAGNSLGDAPSVVTTAPANDVTTSVLGSVITITAAAFTSAGDAVGYTITDVDTEAVTGTITVSIPDAVPQLQDAADTTINLGDSATITMAVQQLGNGASADHAVNVSQAQFGTVSNAALNPAGTEVSFDYQTTGFGMELLTVQLIDGDGSIGAGNANITVPNLTPQVADATRDIVLTGPTTVTVACQLGDGAVADHTATVTGAAWGTVDEESVEINDTGTLISFDYTPTGFAATDALTVQLADANGDVDSGTATLTIEGAAVTIEEQDSLAGSANALGPLSLALLLGIPLLRGRRRKR